MDQLTQIIAIVGVVLYWLILGVVAIRIVIKRRSIGVSFSWLLIIYFLPFVGVFAYLLFGELHLGKTRSNRSKAMYKPYAEWFKALYEHNAHKPESQSHYAIPISHLCDTQLRIPSLTANEMVLKHTTDDILNSIISDINKAKNCIHMEFYIWHPGGLADEVANALIAASQRNVAIKLLLDAAGSRHFFKSSWPKLMTDAGIKVVPALIVSPLRMLFRRMDLRLHRKIVVIDNTVGYTGSMNLVDPKYFKQSSEVGEWIDMMVRITGPVVPVINTVSSWDWEVETNERFLPEQPPAAESTHTSSLVQVIPSGPGMPEDVIHQVLLQSLYQARTRIVITTPYFVPSEYLLVALVTAALRGVDVNIIIPRRNDSTMVKWASSSFFTELLNAGIKVHQFNGGLLHTKSVLIDDEHCLIGTVNMDMRSLWLNFELTLAVDDVKFANKLQQLQQSYINDSKQLSLEEWNQRPWYKRVIEQVFYLFSPLL
ncbi:cardiolipin synthase [Shewanella sp. 10N.286.48.A6]|uniref:cardiolipin synthase n=1 Tax=Shewanella sp. 10N.286.48.A6 TaxID=1880833 RepID=UPI000C854EC7|nr:cardiolipin synthase [Shewanella sp. 10N.286.48.A6]PMI02309.1 cardiolipin synthase [Shewanella sp. 10N.286.48.A6]